jgi:glycosyltransferase involved in cell wall biosynthesis
VIGCLDYVLGLANSWEILMRVALIHYWLVGMRGGEKVVEEICRIWPDADIFTHVYDASAISETIRSHKVSTTFIQRLPAARRLYRKYLPLMPAALENLDLSSYDLIISSEAGPAKGILAEPSTMHICYCHSPMRYIWDQYGVYRDHADPITRAFFAALLPAFRMWDVASANRVDHFIASSSFIANRISKYYRRDAEVIHPPVDVERFSACDEIEDYYFCFGQLTAYKRFDLAVRAFTQLGKKLIVAGSGEEEKRLKSLAGPTVTFLGWQSDAEIERLLRHCRALIFPGVEDFGIAPVEAMASGRPVIGFGAGGILETVIDGVTGKFFHEVSASALAQAVLEFEACLDIFDPKAIRAHSERFRNARFADEFRAAVMRQFSKSQRPTTLSNPRAACIG